MNETEGQTRLRRQRETIKALQEAENTARKALADAVSATKRARERYEEMHLAEERAEVARRKAGYYHATK